MLKHIIFLLFPFTAFVQNLDSLPPMPKINFEKVTNGLEKQPFEIAWANHIIKDIDQIELVQLRPLCENGDLIETLKDKENIEGCYQESILFSSSKFDTLRMYKIKELPKNENEQLIKVCFGKRVSDVINMCYIPRHAVIFKDKRDSILCVCEICFGCGNIVLSTDVNDYISIYEEDYRYLKNVFLKNGYELK